MSRPVKKKIKTVKNGRQRRGPVADRKIRRALEKLMREGRFRAVYK